MNQQQQQQQQQIIPSRTVIASFSPTSSSSSSRVENYDEGQYVLHVTSSPDNTTLSCALSNQFIQTYDRSTLKLISKYQPHSNSITCIQYIDPNIILSSSTDGSCKLYDVRSNSILSTLLLNKEEALTVDVGYNGVLAAVGGSSSNIHFYDLRNIKEQHSNNITQPLGSYVDAHTDDVTFLKFQSSSSSLLASASEDSLINVFDTSQPTEETALTSVMNTNTPLRQVGFFGPKSEGIWALTGNETLQVWHHDSCQLIRNYETIRQHLSQLNQTEIQYLVGCHWSERLQELNLVAGTTDGDCWMYQVEADNVTVKQNWSSGHKASIRSFVASDYGNQDCFVTAGEDSRLCEWCINGNGISSSVNVGQETNAATVASTRHTLKTGGGVIRRQKKKKAHTPY